MEATFLVEIEEFLNNQKELNNFNSFLIGFILAKKNQNSIIDLKQVHKGILNVCALRQSEDISYSQQIILTESILNQPENDVNIQ